MAKVNRTCEYCCRIFLARACEVAIGRGRYCSIPCSNAGKVKPQDEKKRILTAEYLREHFSYDCSTGLFTRLKDSNNQCKAGDTAGFQRHDGYFTIWMLGRSYLNHRLAWLYVHGAWPKGQIDHMDGNPSNNRIANLRDVTMAENNQNRLRPHRNNESGFLGVSLRSDGLYYPRVMNRGKLTVLEACETGEEAHAAYVEAKRQMHPGNLL